MEFDRQLTDVLSEFARTLVTDFPIQAILDHLVVRIVDVLADHGRRRDADHSGRVPAIRRRIRAAALQFEELQTELGEGPVLAAYDTGNAVAIPDLRLDERFPTVRAESRGARTRRRCSRSRCAKATRSSARSTCTGTSPGRWTPAR